MDSGRKNQEDVLICKPVNPEKSGFACFYLSLSLSLLFLLDEHQVHVFQANHQIPHLQQQHGRGHRDDEGGRRRHLPRQGAEGQYGCHMAIARFLDRMCLAFRA